MAGIGHTKGHGRADVGHTKGHWRTDVGCPERIGATDASYAQSPLAGQRRLRLAAKVGMGTLQGLPSDGLRVDMITALDLTHLWLAPFSPPSVAFSWEPPSSPSVAFS